MGGKKGKRVKERKGRGRERKDGKGDKGGKEREGGRGEGKGRPDYLSCNVGSSVQPLVYDPALRLKATFRHQPKTLSLVILTRCTQIISDHLTYLLSSHQQPL